MIENQTNKQQKKSVVEEIIKLKFPNEPEDSEKIHEFLQELCDEVLEIVESAEEECECCSGGRKEPTESCRGVPNHDDFPEGMIPFLVIKRDTTFLDLGCPSCGESEKISIRKFDKQQFYDFDCPKCGKSVLLKLEFLPSIRQYLAIDTTTTETKGE